MRRFVVALAVVASAGFGTGLAASANASGPCEQPAPACHAYDTAKAETGAALAQAVADCAATFESTPCPQLATAGGTVYSDVFFPYDVCYHVNDSTSGCIGPIE